MISTTQLSREIINRQCDIYIYINPTEIPLKSPKKLSTDGRCLFFDLSDRWDMFKYHERQWDLTIFLKQTM